MLKVNDLVGYKNRKIFQDDNYFCFSVDAVFLANFTTLKKATKKVLDIGTGNAPIPLILTLRKEDLSIDAVEIQEELMKLAEQSVKENHLEENIKVIHRDILDYYKETEGNTYDLIVCNPPFFKITTETKFSIGKQKRNARHEVYIKLEDYFKVAKKLLKNNGILSMIHRSERFLEIIELYQKYDIAPTRVKFIHSDSKSISKLFFIEGIKSSKSSLKIENPFIICDDKGQETKEYKELLEKVM